MAFLDNSGDIILDAVLTDTGRMRLAKGDGSFNISKFALSDDEIDYSLYVANTGSAYADLSIMQTPILEAFTNNMASVKSKVISLTNNNLLYLPIIKLNPTLGHQVSPASGIASGTFAILVDSDTVAAFGENSSCSTGYYIDGFNGPGGQYTSQTIRLDQGLDTDEISSAFNLEAELTETQYIVEMDNRFGRLVTIKGALKSWSYIDDDNIASYFVSQGNIVFPLDPNPTVGNVTDSNIAGPRGTSLMFSILSSTNLTTSTFLFNQVGSSSTFDGVAFQFIDSIIRVQGATTGYKIEIPVRFIKKT